MAIERFPDPAAADENGLLAVGGDLDAESLLLAYRSGIFPWPMPGLPLLWFCPAERAVLKFAKFHVARSLQRVLKKMPYRVTMDQDFEQVILACSKMPRREGNMTWITQEMIRGYTQFHKLGFAHSVEVWEGETLVGGAYGVAIDGVFSGESMFRTKANASKVAIVHLVEFLKARGLAWMDIQVMTPHMQAMGAEVLSRDEFLSLLTQSRQPGKKLF